MPKISVIIPVYNVENYLRECLDSIINQTFKDIEIICVDDCSTDNSLDILNEYAQKDNRIKVFEQKENSGQGAARNFGISIAQGEYITFVDPDDYIESTMYEKMYNQAKTLNSEIVMCDVQKFFETSGNIKLYNAFKKYKNVYENEPVNLTPFINIEKSEVFKTILISPNWS